MFINSSIRVLTCSTILGVGVCLSGCDTTQNAGSGDSGSEASMAAIIDGTSATLWVHGMSCPFCATKIEKQMAQIDGVQRTIVDMGTGQVMVALDDDRIPTKDQLVGAVDAAGFTLVRIEMPAGATK